MSRKKKNQRAPDGRYHPNPFSNLKGFVVSPGQQPLSSPEEESEQGSLPEADDTSSFDERMALMGVKPLSCDSDGEDREPGVDRLPAEDPDDDDDLFLEAMERLEVSNKDHWPGDEAPQPVTSKRLKLLKQGKLKPQGILDLHGCKRDEVATKLTHFLQNAAYQGWWTVLVITGKGLHSQSGEAVVRQEVERFLSFEGRRRLVEWARAPRRYGGSGALVLFLSQAVEEP